MTNCLDTVHVVVQHVKLMIKIIHKCILDVKQLECYIEFIRMWCMAGYIGIFGDIARTGEVAYRL